jgi:hypothetical protein
MSEEVLNVPLFLENIRTNDKYREEFLVVAPDVKADVVSFQDNPNCGCRRKIVDYVDKNKDAAEIKGFFANWKAQIPNLFINVSPTVGKVVKPTSNGVMTVEAVKESAPAAPAPQPASATSVKVMAGHVVEIPASPEEYKNLLAHGSKDRWVYRGLSIMEKKNAAGQDVWLVFFF